MSSRLETDSDGSSSDKDAAIAPVQLLEVNSSQRSNNPSASNQSKSDRREAFKRQRTQAQSQHDERQDAAAHHVHEIKPWKIHELIARWPCLCCLHMLWWFVFCAILCATIPGLFTFSTQTPFYIRDNEATQMKDALVSGKQDATWQRTTEEDVEQQQEIMAEVDLRLVYIVKSGTTLMQREHLELIDEIESKIAQATNFEEHCKRMYAGQGLNGDAFKCSRQQSLANFFDVDYFLPSRDQSYTLYPSLTNTQSFFAPSRIIDATIDLDHKNYSDAFIDKIVTYWAGYDNGEGPSTAYAPKYYAGEQMPAKFNYQMFVDGDLSNFSVSNVFSVMASKSFAYDTPLDKDVDAALSMFAFGLPLSGYTSSSEQIKEQHDDIGKWCFEKLHPMLTDFAAKHADKFDFYWDCANPVMGSLYANQLMAEDGMFMIATFTSVYILMIVNTGSVWLGSCGMAMIGLNFFPAFLLYRFIAGLEYFGTLCMLSMFIILAIGADDIFVICDTWAQYRTAAPNEPMAKRLTVTLKHAGKVMATTSASTCFSFIGNTTSVFPAVYTFGAFAAWLVFVNYCAVVLFYPTVLAVHDTYFHTPNLKRGCCVAKRCSKANCAKRCCCRDNAEDETIFKEQRAIDAWFEHSFFPRLYKHRVRVLNASLIFFLVFFYLSVQLEADPEAPQFFPDGDNYNEFPKALSDNFASQTQQQLTAEIVWGIDGIDRDGTDETITEDIGQVIYSESVSFFSGEEQQYICQFCDDLLCLYSDYACRYPASVYHDLKIFDPENVGGERTHVVSCFMTAFRDWVLSDSSAQPSTAEITALLIEHNQTSRWTASDFADCQFGVFPVDDLDCFAFLFGVVWINEALPTSSPDYVAGITNYDHWKSKYGFKEEENPTNPFGHFFLKFFTVSVLTEASLTYEYNAGIELFEDWQAFVRRWRDNADGQTTTDRFGAEFVRTPSTLSSVMATDRGFFSYYFIQRQIIREAVVGIALSLLFAFIILTLATQNWLMALYSVVTIFAIVICIVGFTVANGWKLGVIEAIIYVMVVGMSVDYVVHLSEAYLASGQRDRKERTARMLGIVGGSVLSGAMSTIFGILWLLLATIAFFVKFGAFICFLIAVSLAFSMLTFSAAMSSFGPEGDSGNIIVCYRKCKRKLQGDE